MLKNVPLKSLRFFEAAARNLSFKAAASELNVTPAAVGKQIKTLEEFLGVKLFDRLTRSIALSAQGQEILPGVREGLQKIETTLNSLSDHNDLGILSVTTVHSFAAKWLFPRLGKFSLKHPDIDVRLTATSKVLDFVKDHVDIAIRSAPQDPQTNELNSVLLSNETIIPVCAPGLLKKGPALQELSDLRFHTLIHDDTMALHEDCDWATLCKIANIEGIDTTRGPRFNPSTMAIQAAINGLGVTLARKSLAHDDLISGQLVAPFDFEMPSKISYYLVYPKEMRHQASIQVFRDWILEEASNLAQI